MIDLPDADPELLRGELRNLRKINRYFGGLSSVRKALLPLILSSEPSRPLEVLDLGTGSGDQAIALVEFCRTLGRPVSLTALDNNEAVLSEARRQTEAFPEIRVERGDLRALSYAERSFDVTLCSLTAHHFTEGEVVVLLQEMDRLSRVGFVLNDLSRSYLALAAAWIYTRVTTTNIMTRTDAIASLFAAFTRAELAAMAVAAGVRPVTVSRSPMFRLNVVLERQRVS